MKKEINLMDEAENEKLAREMFTEMEDQDKDDDKAIAQELVDKIDGMQKDTDRKLESAKEQLIEKLDVLAAKYRTANGVKAAMDTIYGLLPGGTDADVTAVMGDARIIAKDLSDKCLHLKEKAQALGYMDLKDLTVGEYVVDATVDIFYTMEMARELMVLELLANVGPNADDIAEFCEYAHNEIADTIAQLDEMIKEHPEFAELVPTKDE